MQKALRVNTISWAATGILFALTAACISGTARAAVTETAVVATLAADYSSAAHAVISVDPPGGPRAGRTDLLPTLTSDITINAYKNFFYRIERFQADNVTKFDISAPETPIWQFSTNDLGETGSSNPYDLLFVNDQKAYLLRYGTTLAWIVNPSAVTAAEFKIGELDLGAYADADGIPEMSAGVIAGDRVFIALQRLDRDNGWVPSNTSYLAVFDTATDKEIDTGVSNSDGVKGIPLPIRNPGSVQYLAENDTVYVQGAGDYGSSWTGRDPEYSGGIAAIDPLDYTVEVVLDDGDDNNHPCGNISGMGIVSAEKGYFVGYAGWGDNTLYAFNPATGAVSGPANDDLKGKNIAGMEAGAYADNRGRLWVCNQTDAEVVILNTADDTIDESVFTNLNPTRVVFTTEGEPDPEPETGGDGGGSGCFISSAYSPGSGSWILLRTAGSGIACLGRSSRQ